jgi:hypothetical protein
MKQIIIETCKECKDFNERRDYTSDSFEMCFKWECKCPIKHCPNCGKVLDKYKEEDKNV